MAGAALALAALDHHVGWVHIQRLGNRRQGVQQARLGLLRVDRARRRVLLHMHPVAIEVDSQSVLGHVGVIQAVALDVLLACPLAQLLEVLLQPIGEHLATFAEACRFATRCGAFALLTLAPFAGHELLRQHFQQQQLAGQGAVPEGVLLVAADAHALAQLRGAGEDRRLPAQAGLAQALAEVLVEVEQAGFVAQALAIGRVADHQALLVLVRTRFEGGQLALVDLHPVAQAGALDVVAAGLDQPRVGFVTANPQRRPGQAGLGTLAGFFMQLLPQCRHMAQPVGEAPALALEVGGHVGGHHRRLHQEGTDAAHGVGQRPALGGDPRPAGADQDGRGQVFLQRRRALLQAVAALVQAVAGEVEGEDRLTLLQAQVDAHVGVDLVDRRPFAAGGAQLVHHRVLDLERTEMGVVDARAMAAELDRERAAGHQVIVPVHRQHALVELLGVPHREALEHQQHPVGQAGPEAQAVGGLQVTLATHRSHLLAHVLQAEARGLFGQQAFKALRAGEEKFVVVRHGKFQGLWRRSAAQKLSCAVRKCVTEGRRTALRRNRKVSDSCAK
ncbi:hypothetical protein D9M69_404260 [compost metagenome]